MNIHILQLVCCTLCNTWISLLRWSKKGPLSLKPLSAWYLDILERVRLEQKVWMVDVCGWMVFVVYNSVCLKVTAHLRHPTKRFTGRRWPQVLPDVVRLGESTALFLGQWHFLPTGFLHWCHAAPWLRKKGGSWVENCETFQMKHFETLQLAKHIEVKFKPSPSNFKPPYSVTYPPDFSWPMISPILSGTLLESMAKRLICYPFARRPWIILAMHQVNWPLLRTMVPWMGDDGWRWLKVGEL